ncbi:hypothetical protein R3X25_02300 [Lutibacter sp. TH_r2]|uniref:hypothetical protein n=1 Tax=Lutibacter sp. TH_r2 TaxID=3082083 RepID=UPI002953C4F5|nr:hypothetical protein [Lutibacter sp. TH_r2]MDV7186100.1 hypothetical protein [Lutibacter sp. TH_r2]
MKKLILIAILIAGAYIFFKKDIKSVIPQTVSQTVNSNDNGAIITVTGKVVRNFKLLYGVYELKDTSTGESIMVSTSGNVPKVGTKVIKRLQKNDVITLNDRTFSLFKELE